MSENIFLMLWLQAALRLSKTGWCSKT